MLTRRSRCLHRRPAGKEAGGAGVQKIGSAVAEIAQTDRNNLDQGADVDQQDQQCWTNKQPDATVAVI